MAVSSALCLFVYGTFLANEVVETLLGRLPPATPAIIQDYRRYAVVARSYSAIIPAQGYAVEGRVLCGISAEELALLDSFEGAEYVRTNAEAHSVEKASVSSIAGRRLLAVGSSGRPHGSPAARSPAPLTSSTSSPSLPCAASVYTWSDPQGSELEGPWDFEEWRREHLDEYLSQCKRFVDGAKGLKLALE